jgi:hypothetical protein
LISNAVSINREYPFDTQLCRVRLQSFEYEVEELVFLWNAGLDSFAKLNTEDFVIDVVQMEPYNRTYYGNAMWVGRTFSRLEFRIVLQRRFANQILETYLPSILFVMCGWLSFLVPRSSIPGRYVLQAVIIPI